MRHRLIVRPLDTSEARTFLQIHSAAVRGLGISHYPPEVIDVWAAPVNDHAGEEFLQRFLVNSDNETRLIAELDGQPAGIGVLVVQNEELRACYVRPEMVRKGVGAAIVREIERLAIQSGLTHLRLDASLNAEPF